MAKTKKSLTFPKPHLHNTQKKVPIALSSVERVVAFLQKESGSKNKGIAIYFVGKKKICDLHEEFFNDPSPTDCISFPYDESDYLGEVFICPSTALSYSKAHNIDLYQELTLYLVHGFLHLLGYDDKTRADIEQMRMQEKKWMQNLEKNHLRITP